MTTPDTPDSDVLDQAIDQTFSGLEIGLAWSFDKLAKVAAEVGALVLHHWTLFAVITFVAVFHRKFMQWQWAMRVIVAYKTKRWIMDAHAKRELNRLHARQQRENAWLARADERRFRVRLAELETKLKYHTGVRDILREMAFPGGRRGAALDAEVEKHEEAVLVLEREIDRLNGLWAQQRVLNLIDRLVNGVEADAKSALGELNQIWRSVNWQAFVPYSSMMEPDQRRVIQLLEVMASNAQLGEARNAFAFALKILRAYQWQWGDRQTA